MFDPDNADDDLAGQTMTELMKTRAQVQEDLEKAEADWLEANEALELADA
jgi:ATP-binding cassette subfamily F protein 3